MLKIFKLVFVAIIITFGILIFSNPNSMKDYTGWMFEGSQDHMALPDLSNEEIEKINSAIAPTKKARAGYKRPDAALEDGETYDFSE